MGGQRTADMTTTWLGLEVSERIGTIRLIISGVRRQAVRHDPMGIRDS